MAVSVNGVESPRVRAKKAELARVCARMRKRAAAQEADLAVRRGLFLELIGLGVRKSEIARLAGIGHAALNFAIEPAKARR